MRYDVRIVLTRKDERVELMLGIVGRMVIWAAIEMMRAEAARYDLQQAYRSLRKESKTMENDR